MFIKKNNNVIISDDQHRIYSIYKLIYDNTELLDHITDEVYANQILNYIKKLKEELKIYESLSWINMIVLLKKS